LPLFYAYMSAMVLKFPIKWTSLLGLGLSV